MTKCVEVDDGERPIRMESVIARLRPLELPAKPLGVEVFAVCESNLPAPNLLGATRQTAESGCGCGAAGVGKAS